MNLAILLVLLASPEQYDRQRVTDPEVKVAAAGQCRDTAGRSVRCPETAADRAIADENEAETLVSILGGTAAAFGSASEEGIQPFVGVDVSAPLSGWDLTPRLNVALQLTAQPGAATPGVTDVGSFKAVAARFQVEQPVDPRVYVAPFCEAGVLARVSGDPDGGRSQKHWGCGLTIGGQGARGYLQGWGGQDQRLVPDTWRLVVGARGSVKLWESDAEKGLTKGGTVRLLGEVVSALRQFNDAQGRPLRDVVAQVAIGVGK
jgi:hypothetical protein